MDPQQEQGNTAKYKPSEAALGSTSTQTGDDEKQQQQDASQQQPANAGQRAENAGPDNIGTGAPLNPDMNH